MTQKIDYASIERAVTMAGLTQTEAAKLFHVSRQTLYNWRKGGKATSLFLFNTAKRLAGYLEQAVEQGKLPLGSDVPQDKRMQAISHVVREVMMNPQTKVDSEQA